MSFINPLLMIGLLAAGIPLILHLWSRRQAKLVDFSHVQFLMSLRRKRIKRLRLKQILILIMRMLIVALIAMALARPILTSKWALAAGGDPNSSVVIVLDNSYSMGYETFEGTKFDIAKEKALNILSKLKSGDKASLILMSDAPDVIFKQLTSNIQQVMSTVEQSELSHKSTRVWSSMREAYSILNKSNHPYKRVYLISDLVENAWKEWINPEVESGSIDKIVVRVGEEGKNHRIESISMSNIPVGMGISTNISAEIAGIDKSQEVTAELFIDNEKKSQTVVTGDTVSFNHVFDSPGSHIGRIELTPDRLPLDDTRYFAVNVLGQIRALCAGDYQFYVNLALNPITSLNPEADFLILPLEVDVDELDSLSLEEYDILILTDIPAVPDTTIQDVENFVLNGGNLLVFLGNRTSPNWYNSKFKLMPGAVGELQRAENKPFHLSEWDRSHTIFRLFTGADEILESIEFYSVFDIEPEPDAKVLAHFNNDIPAVMETETGWGKVILFNTSPDTMVSNIALRPEFLPLIQQTVFSLVSGVEDLNFQQDGRNILISDTYREQIRENMDSTPKIIDPEDKIFTPVISDVEKGKTIQYGPVSESGIHRIEFKSSGGLHHYYFAANIDTSGESEIKLIRDREISDKLGSNTSFIDVDQEYAEMNIRSDRSEGRSDLSSRLLLAALILMLLEIPLANRRKLT
ncbi:VWA domain-containing protein [Candidatus Poribacteria bacterium]|nr:VWA domain-containing protein [Candidatus Poribacteria bacterium]